MRALVPTPFRRTNKADVQVVELLNGIIDRVDRLVRHRGLEMERFTIRRKSS